MAFENRKNSFREVFGPERSVFGHPLMEHVPFERTPEKSTFGFKIQI
jgi:hypothetical protein